MERCYFVDYEVWNEGMPVSWGNLVLACAQSGNEAGPAHLLSLIRERAACERLASPHEIRVRNVTRL